MAATESFNRRLGQEGTRWWVENNYFPVLLGVSEETEKLKLKVTILSFGNLLAQGVYSCRLQIRFVFFCPFTIMPNASFWWMEAVNVQHFFVSCRERGFWGVRGVRGRRGGRRVPLGPSPRRAETEAAQTPSPRLRSADWGGGWSKGQNRDGVSFVFRVHLSDM